MTSVVFFYQVFGVYIFRWFPRVIRGRIPSPFDQVLEMTLSPVESVIDDCFDFVFLRVFNQVWWWALKVGAVDSCLPVGQ